jgi:hypothetical protein
VVGLANFWWHCFLKLVVMRPLVLCCILLANAQLPNVFDAIIGAEIKQLVGGGESNATVAVSNVTAIAENVTQAPEEPQIAFPEIMGILVFSFCLCCFALY